MQRVDASHEGTAGQSPTTILSKKEELQNLLLKKKKSSSVTGASPLAGVQPGEQSRSPLLQRPGEAIGASPKLLASPNKREPSLSDVEHMVLSLLSSLLFVYFSSH